MRARAQGFLGHVWQARDNVQVVHVHQQLFARLEFGRRPLQAIMLQSVGAGIALLAVLHLRAMWWQSRRYCSRRRCATAQSAHQGALTVPNPFCSNVAQTCMSKHDSSACARHQQKLCKFP